MASTICTPSILCSSSAHRRSSSTIFSFSDSVIFCSKTSKTCLSKSIPGLGISSFQPWNGLRHMGISVKQNYVRKEGKGRCRGKVVYASLFGVGAPEALVIGVVALLVFGPKGLAEVARNLGKTLRSFQPTIRELQDVSREFKNTLEREIGLDEVPPSMQNSNRSTSATSSQPMSDLNGIPSASKPYSSEEYLKVTEEQLAYAAQSKEGQSQEETSQQEGAPQAERPLNIGEFLVQEQLRSATSQQEETLLREGQSDAQPQPQPQPQATAPETDPKISPPEKIESEA